MSVALELDDPGELTRYDKSGMLELIESLPGQYERASGIALAFKLPVSYRRRYANVVCCGMGGSAIGADLSRAYVVGKANIPFCVNRDYVLPGFVSENSLIVISSYSGNTEEVYAAYTEAMARKAKIVIITSGGKIEDSALRNKLPVLKIPGGLPPRCAIGYSLFPILILMDKTGIVKLDMKSLRDSTKALIALRDNKIGGRVPYNKNVAKNIAAHLHNKIPVIYGAQSHIGAVVARWRGQLEENSKIVSSSNLLPEMNHNEITGWNRNNRSVKDLAVVMLRDSGDHPMVSKRIEITKRIIKKAGGSVAEVKSAGGDLLARMLSLSYIGDFVSYYLARLNKVDPTPVKEIAFLKEALAER